MQHSVFDEINRFATRLGRVVLLARLMLLALGLMIATIENVDAQALPAPLLPPVPNLPTLPATPSLSATPSFVGSTHPPAPTMLQVLTSAQRGFCARLRVSPIGQMAASMRKPLSAVTGGLIPSEKAPHADEQAQPGPQGTAAQLKAVNLQSPKRQAAVKELQGIDVRYHPEAEAILISALRADPSECVRYEAAITLSNLPVCTEPIAKALQVCIESSTRDGNPAELSQRVRSQAAFALAKCQCCLPPTNDDTQPRPEYPTGDTLQSTSAEQLAASRSTRTNDSIFRSASWSNQSSLSEKGAEPLAESTGVGQTPFRIGSESLDSPAQPKNLLEVFNNARQQER